MEEWKNFKGDLWKKEINVSDFIKNNYKEYTEDENFLVGITKKTDKVWNKCLDLLKEELECHVLDIDTDNMSGINSCISFSVIKPNSKSLSK